MTSRSKAAQVAILAASDHPGAMLHLTFPPLCASVANPESGAACPQMWAVLAARQLLRRRLRAWGCPPHSRGETQRLASRRLRPHSQKLTGFAAFGPNPISQAAPARTASAAASTTAPPPSRPRRGPMRRPRCLLLLRRCVHPCRAAACTPLGGSSPRLCSCPSPIPSHPVALAGPACGAASAADAKIGGGGGGPGGGGGAPPASLREPGEIRTVKNHVCMRACT